ARAVAPRCVRRCTARRAFFSGRRIRRRARRRRHAATGRSRRLSRGAPRDGSARPRALGSPVSTIRIIERGWLGRIDLGELWRYRDLLLQLARRDIQLRYRQMLLGVAWAILQPVATMAVLSVVFDRFAKIPSDGFPYPLFAFAALLPWQLFALALSQSSNST